MFIIIETTIDDINIAHKIINKLLDDKLSSCVQIIKDIQSHYIWKGKKEITNEFRLSIKAKNSYIDKITKIINDYHNYDVPEIISFNINILNNDYKNWLINSHNAK